MSQPEARTSRNYGAVASSLNMVLCLANTGRITTRIFMALPSRILRRIPPQPLAITVARHNLSRLASRMVSSRRGPAISRRAAGRTLKAANSPVRAHIRRVPGHAGPAVWSTAERSASPAALLPRIDLNDPNQNPLYGHWDSYAIISFILALFFRCQCSRH